MKKGVFIIMVWVGMVLPNFSYGRIGSFSQLAYQTVHQTWSDLKGLGIISLSPWDPRLPRPQVPAMEAVVNPNKGLLAYYDEEYFGYGTRLLFKAPNGGERHVITFNSEAIQFLTPYAGTIAHSNRFMTVNGPGYNFYCQSQPVTEAAFYECIQALYINVIVNQLKP